MSKKDGPARTELELDRLGDRLGELVKQFNLMEAELDQMRDVRSQLSEERDHLLAKNEEARTRVEAMISRLKNMEIET